MDDLIDFKRLCGILGVTEGTLRVMIARGRVPPHFSLPGGRKVYWRAEDIEKWVAEGEKNARNRKS